MPRPKLTHCKRGHERIPENLYSSGGRSGTCRLCMREAAQKPEHRTRARQNHRRYEKSARGIAAKRRYNEANRERINARIRASRKARPVLALERNRRYRMRHREVIRSWDRNRYWRNIEASRFADRSWYRRQWKHQAYRLLRDFSRRCGAPLPGKAGLEMR
jgi:hypothetical protein